MKSNLAPELTANALKDPALAGIDTADLRHRILALAELRLLKMLNDGDLDPGVVKNLMAIIKPLALMEIREKDLAEKRSLTETIRLNREEQRQREREEKQKAGAHPRPPSTPAPVPSRQTPPLNAAPPARLPSPPAGGGDAEVKTALAPVQEAKIASHLPVERVP